MTMRLRLRKPAATNQGKPARGGGSGGSRCERKMKDKPYSWAGAANADFDATAMNEFVGKYMLIAVTFVDGSGQEEASVQMHGVVTSVSEQGITISLKGE